MTDMIRYAIAVAILGGLLIGQCPAIAAGVEPAGPHSGQDIPAVPAQAVLYEEDLSNPQGERVVGSAIWRTETIPSATDKPEELAVRADIEIPERRLAVLWKLRREDGRSTSHTIEITFKLPPDLASGDISNVPGVLMKRAESTRGTPLAGLSAKVASGYFLIALSGAPTDREQNLQLLKRLPWLDIPFVCGNNRRALLAIEKGAAGERAFADAFAAWEK
jgi:hypothetical protein